MSAATAREQTYFAQFGEDEILAVIFGGRERGTCVEVGAHDGVNGSNTLYFERRGWDCVLVEPVPALVAAIRRQRQCTVVECAASSHDAEATLQVAEHVESMSALAPDAEHSRRVARLGGRWVPLRVRTRTLDSILDEAGFKSLDFATIDVEGHELEVLRGLSLDRFRPGIVIVEAGDEGAAAAVRSHLKGSGYRPFLRTVVNHWYATPELLTTIDVGAAQRLARAREREVRLATRIGPFVRWVPIPLRLAAVRAIRPLLALGRHRAAQSDPEDPCRPPS
jgi:FkbM family methyltransferase